MKSPFSSDKRSALARALHTRQQALERQMTLHRQGQSRVDFAREALRCVDCQYLSERSL